MNWLIDNWSLLICTLAVIMAVCYAITTFIHQPYSMQIENLKGWLHFAVMEAEKELGSGTGQAKLSMVYGMFIQQMPWVARVISFDVFANYVDEALEWLRNQLDTNPNIKKVVNDESI